jgi:dynein heavy chain
MNRLKISSASNPSEFPMVESSTFNPKAITIDELYGVFDTMTQTWTDGLASKLIREYTVR